MPLPPGIHHLRPTLPIHVFEAEAPGPTALIQAGIHGDEIAGVHALAELLEAGRRPLRGRLLVIPVMNPPAYRARTRAAPGGLDLNRCFPGDPADPAAERRLAAAHVPRSRHSSLSSPLWTVRCRCAVGCRVVYGCISCVRLC
jgi:predicted deacylase